MLALWPQERLDEAVQALFRHLGAEMAVAPPTDGSLDDWIAAAGTAHDFDVDAVDVTGSDLDGFLSGCAPALLQVPGGVVAVLGRGLFGIRCLGPGGRPVTIAVETLRTALIGTLEASRAREVERVLETAGIAPARRAPARRAAARRALLRRQLAGEKIRAGGRVRRSPGAPLPLLLREAKIGRLAATVLLLGLLAQSLMVLSWMAIGRPALEGHVAAAQVDIWSLLLVCAIPLHAVAIRCEGLLSLRLGALIKRRLLFGILQLDPDQISGRGAGHFMGLAMDAEVMEMVSLSFGHMAVLGLVQLLGAVVLMAFATGSRVSSLLLVVWLAGCVWLVREMWRCTLRSNACFRALATNLVESMEGHRTRLVQEHPEHWHGVEDPLLAARARAMADRHRTLQLRAGVARGWLAVALLGVGADMVLVPGDMGALSLCLFGIMLAYQAFESLGHSLSLLTDFGCAWRNLTPIFTAARRPHPGIRKGLPEPGAAPVLEAEGIGHSYVPGGRAVLQDCSLAIRPGERLLLESPSGGGKSTLAALLAGHRLPTIGRLSLNGLERGQVGDADWRRRVLAVPQFHQNHIFSASMAFNLLMGRGWPPSAGDLDECRRVCGELGLGPLLERMPGGLDQMVGDGGWALSHGERSRLFIARAMLQNADVVILDESFSALDPETLEQALTCVLKRAPSLLVIAHP